MSSWDIGMRHIVDVDGQLLAIDAEVIDTASLLARANRAADRHLWLLRAGERFLFQPKQLIRLSEEEVLYFETTPSFLSPVSHRLAA